ncbi:unnamed protein product [Lota lota]
MTTWRLPLLSLTLLLIFTKMIASLIVFAAVFIDSHEVTISPFNFCSKVQDAKILSCQALPWTTVIGASETTMIISTIAVILCLYVPLVLVPFALLSSLLSAYGEGDIRVLQLSMGCQAASSALTLLGLVWFVGLHWAYASPSAMTLCYYSCVLATAELTITTYLSSLLLRKPITNREDKCWKKHKP